MEFMNPTYLWLLSALPVFLAVWFFWGRRAHTLNNTQVSRVRVSTKLGAALTVLIWISKIALWSSLSLGMVGTVFLFDKIATDAAGVIYVTVDTSGSTKVGGVHFDYENWLAYFFDPRTNPAYEPKSDDPEEKKRESQPIDTELGAVRVFIEHALGLRVGLTVFDDKFFYTYPATKDSQVAIDMLPQIRKYAQEISSGGTNFDGPFEGRMQDGGLQGALYLFNKEDGNAVRIYIMVTDGMAPIDPDRGKELAEKYKELGIHFFVFGVDTPWTNLDNTSLKPIIDFAKSVDGQVVQVQDEAQFKAAIVKIEELARSSVRTIYVKDRQDSLLILLAIALVSFVMWLGLSAIRRSSL